MKPEDFMENICRCLERIENEVNRLSSFQAIDGRYEIDNNINKTMQSDQTYNNSKLKYCYTEMKDEIPLDQITLFEINRDIIRIKQICKKEKGYISQLTFAEQARQKEKAIKGLDSGTKSIEGKTIQVDESEE
ncbi:hypothetical protein [Bacteroides nordii]|uniref:Uncharacterized protein n=1 Tax=Bacteroides nordii CL02T12C05 TaxID=997884 RepID=I9GJ22_9BACE|nr:hypothetical protein [Bacteroides nordii]EIY46734.1 hypothetical protein HMPREF1068_03502 [Bacteroides nordii CL02T12C05]MCG4771026.1 hypothetical protein [Bacteroides nordii]GFZ39557.1 hypothetical protein BANORC5_15920 [Bacteroides nordii]